MNISLDNFYINTFVVFKGCKTPKRTPDYISYYTDWYSGERRVSSRYWYGKNTKGTYIIRESDHWSSINNHVSCKNVASCIWEIHSNNKEYNKAGKAYLSWFKSRK